MSRPCTCDKMIFGQPYIEGQCRLCWLYHNAEDYQAYWDAEGPTKVHVVNPKASRRKPCNCKKVRPIV